MKDFETTLVIKVRTLSAWECSKKCEYLWYDPSGLPWCKLFVKELGWHKFSRKTIRRVPACRSNELDCKIVTPRPAYPEGTIDTKEAARSLGVGVPTVYALIHSGRLPAKKYGIGWRPACCGNSIHSDGG